MNFQTKTEDSVRLGLNPQHNMLHMLSQPQSNMNGFFLPQNTSQPLLNGMGQDISSLLQGQTMINPLNQGNVSFNQKQIPQLQQMIGGISAQNIDANSLQQQLLLQQSQSQQSQQNQNMNILLLLQQLQQQQQQQQQVSQFQQVQQQPQQKTSQQLQQQSLSQQQLLLQQHLQLIQQNQFAQNQRTNNNNSNLLLNFGQNNSNTNNMPLNPFGLKTLHSHQQSQSTQVKQEEQDMGYDEEEMEDEEQVTAQQSPNQIPSKNMEFENKFDFQLDAEARARAATDPSFNPIGDYKMVMMHTPVPNKRDNIFASLNQQLATQQLIHQNSLTNPKLPEFQLNQIQPQLQLQNFLQMVKMNNNSQMNNVKINNNSNSNMNFSPMNINPNTLTKEQINDLKRQFGVTVRDRETLAPFLEQWNSIQETEQIIAGSYAVLKSFPYEKTEQYENVFQVEYTEQSQKCNYVNKFINSKGLIVKDEKLGKIKIENKISRFHNLSRLLMYTILTAFNKNNIAQMNLDHLKQDAITKTIQRLKQSARKKTPKGLIKTDFFNHTHYNVLFLTINEQNIEQVRKNSKDVGTHMKVFNVNLERPYHEIVEEIRYSNIIKKLAYHIMLASYKKSKDDKKDVDQNNSSNSTFREQYIDRAMLGIGKLNQGVLIQRF